MRKLAIAAALAGGLMSTTAYAVPTTIPADIIWVIDVSASMGGDLNQVRTRIGQFNTAMVNNGINASYGLMEFGGNVIGSTWIFA